MIRSLSTSCYAAEPSACALQSGQKSERCSHLGVERRRIRGVGTRLHRTLPAGSERLRRSSRKCRAAPTRSLASQAAGVASCGTAKAALPAGGAAASRRPCGSYAHTPACTRPGSGQAAESASLARPHGCTAAGAAARPECAAQPGECASAARSLESPRQEARLASCGAAKAALCACCVRRRTPARRDK